MATQLHFSEIAWRSEIGLHREGNEDSGFVSFDFVDGAGVSLRIHERLNAHALLSHTYTRFYGRLSAGSASSMLDGMYLNYFGLRAGVSFRF